jgi:hypothetical protein
VETSTQSLVTQLREAKHLDRLQVGRQRPLPGGSLVGTDYIAVSSDTAISK